MFEFYQYSLQKFFPAAVNEVGDACWYDVKMFDKI